jgi:hypothetical protein
MFGELRKRSKPRNHQEKSRRSGSARKQQALGLLLDAQHEAACQERERTQGQKEELEDFNDFVQWWT